MNDNIFIPKKLKIGFQKREDTFTKKLAYVIYYDEKNKLRKEQSWKSWRDEKIVPLDAKENDKKILDLKSVIEAKKSKLKKINFAPTTNCSLELDGTRHNIHTLTAEALTFLLVKLNSYVLSMKSLKINTLSISGYSINDWTADIKLKLDIISQKEEENKLKVLESKLAALLSNDKKTELELDNIEKLLS